MAARECFAARKRDTKSTDNMRWCMYVDRYLVKLFIDQDERDELFVIADPSRAVNSGTVAVVDVDDITYMHQVTRGTEYEIPLRKCVEYKVSDGPSFAFPVYELEFPSHEEREKGESYHPTITRIEEYGSSTIVATHTEPRGDEEMVVIRSDGSLF